ncbi:MULTISPECIES: response regulator [Spirosoma]|uniref:Response regulator n=1 Tax=Spirosoma liriopis TaxID=2937440 RepID=A0ABT0HSM3_9BACT|nr:MULTISPECIES: response regulator [Spirosoma]MCK8495180.1 response regulator [Spirosoma liriopis]UHG94233.1 response regulator [Spirosoma oryzicola]
MHRFPILLLEDDLAIVDIIQRTAKISFPQASFIRVDSFEEAVIYFYNLEGYGPKLVLIDINLVGSKTGLDFLALLKEHPIGRLIPAIVLSASPSLQHRRQAYQLGATSFFRKPFSLQDWKKLFELIQVYWYQTVSLAPTWYEKHVRESR